jgi:UDP-glucose 4-epimerase
MTSKMLITGGAGCIGSELAEALLDRGHEIVIYDNLSSGRKSHIEALLQNRRCRFVEGDLLDGAKLDEAMAGVHVVWHLAANPDVKFTPGEATDKDLRQNTMATYQVLETMRRHEVKRLAFSSTSAVYGEIDVFPISESQAPQPISLYGASKLACEGLVRAFQNLFYMQCWIFRFANIVGSRQRARGRTVIGDFIHKLRNNPHELPILGNGKQAKSYLLSSECVSAMLHIVDHEIKPISIYNLGCEDWLTVDRIAEMVVAAMGLKDVRFTYTGTAGGWPGDVPRFLLDVSALKKLGWQASQNSEQAVAHAIRSALETAANE